MAIDLKGTNNQMVEFWRQFTQITSNSIAWDDKWPLIKNVFHELFHQGATPPGCHRGADNIAGS